LNYNLSDIFRIKLKNLKDLQLNLFTLSFYGTNHYLEQEFIEFYFEEKLPQIRIAIIIGVFIFSLFGILDAVLADRLKYIFWGIRYGIILPYAVIGFIITYFSFFKKYNQLIIMIGCMATCLGIIAMIVLAWPPVSYFYYTGLIIVFIFIYTFTGLRFIWANATCWCVVIIFEIVAVFFKDIPFAILISNTFFFVSANVLSMFAAYFIEYSLRKNFYLARMLEIEKEKVNHTKNNLQDLVEEQTIQLAKANKGLREELAEKKDLITQQKNLQEQLVRAQKMEGIGLLAKGIAHDFNNILSSIMGNSDLADLSITYNDIEKTKTHISYIRTGALRAAELTHQILTFTRPEKNKKQLLDISIIVKEALGLLKASIPVTIDISENILSDTFAMADPVQIHQVVMNLCTNASHSMGASGGTLGVGLVEIEIIDENTMPDLDILPGKYLKLSVSDTGHGMDTQTLKKIFDPYFTTKGIGEGTGLGLALVYGIVKGHDGVIQVYSSVGKGSVLNIFLPAATEKELMNMDKNT